MAFTVVHGSPMTVWTPITDSATLYVGQLVVGSAEGVTGMAQAAGHADTTNCTGDSTENVPFGVVIGTNNMTPLFNSTYNAEYITDATPLASTTQFTGMEGPWIKGSKQAMVQVAVITPSTVLRGDIRKGAVGTAITVGTISGGVLNGVKCTTSSLAYGKETSTKYGKTFQTAYFRSGAAMGEYRILDSDSSASLTWDKALTVAATAGDTVTAVTGLRPVGLSNMQIGSPALFVEGQTDASTNNFKVIVTKLDLAEAGKEYVEFMFCSEHWCTQRA